MVERKSPPCKVISYESQYTDIESESTIIMTILALSLGEMGSTRLWVGLSNVSTESTFKLILQEGSRVVYCGFPQVDEL